MYVWNFSRGLATTHERRWEVIFGFPKRHNGSSSPHRSATDALTHSVVTVSATCTVRRGVSVGTEGRGVRRVVSPSLMGAPVWTPLRCGRANLRPKVVRSGVFKGSLFFFPFLSTDGLKGRVLW